MAPIFSRHGTPGPEVGTMSNPPRKARCNFGGNPTPGSFVLIVVRAI